MDKFPHCCARSHADAVRKSQVAVEELSSAANYDHHSNELDLQNLQGRILNSLKNRKMPSRD